MGTSTAWEAPKLQKTSVYQPVALDETRTVCPGCSRPHATQRSGKVHFVDLGRATLVHVAMEPLLARHSVGPAHSPHWLMALGVFSLSLPDFLTVSLRGLRKMGSGTLPSE